MILDWTHFDGFGFLSLNWLVWCEFEHLVGKMGHSLFVSGHSPDQMGHSRTKTVHSSKRLNCSLSVLSSRLLSNLRGLELTMLMWIRTFDRRNGPFAEVFGPLAVRFGPFIRLNGPFAVENGPLAQRNRSSAKWTFTESCLPIGFHIFDIINEKGVCR